MNSLLTDLLGHLYFHELNIFCRKYPFYYSCLLITSIAWGALFLHSLHLEALAVICTPGQTHDSL